MTVLKHYKKQVLMVLFCIIGTHSWAQIDPVAKGPALPYSEFLNKVMDNNLEYAAEKYNVNIAEAGILVAKIMPDPELALEGGNNGQQRMALGYNYGSSISWTLELGGKRQARIAVARTETELSQLLLADYFNKLRAHATISYLEAIKQKNLLDVNLNSYQTMKALNHSDSIRFKLGTIMEIDLRQSKLEAGTLLNDVYQNEADWKSALENLAMQFRTEKTDSLWFPKGDLSTFDRQFKLEELMETALNNRSDLQATLTNTKLAQSQLQLTKANRVMDLGLSVGVSGTTVQYNHVAPTPSFTTVGGGITIPLKFSNNSKGELKQAEYSVQQNELIYKQAILQIQSEVKQAYYNYIAAQKQVEQFNTGLLNEAKKVFDGKVYSYQRGASSLLEVLNAQRTYNEVQLTYHTTRYTLAAALVELEKSVGIWDINL